MRYNWFLIVTFVFYTLILNKLYIFTTSLGANYIGHLFIKTLKNAPCVFLNKELFGKNADGLKQTTSIKRNKSFQQFTFYQTLDANQFLKNAMAHLANAQAFPNKASYPRSVYTDGTTKRVGASDWTSGFFPGALWYMYENTKDTIWRTRAQQWSAGLEGQKYNTSTHDVGFMLFSSFGMGYRLTGNEKYKAILLQGAKSLSSRFNPTVGCIKSWDNKSQFTFPVIIDNLMNLEILFWATKISGDSSYYKIAVKHALTTMNNHFRPDNSSFHVVDYNPVNGSIIAKVTYQGLNNLSDWSRGQAWGLYGYTICFRETGDMRFLRMAEKIADFYTTHPNMPSDFIPYWDFDAFNYRDASAACIASSALLELSQFIPEKRTVYYNFGVNTLKSISSNAYSALPNTNNNFVLKHCVGNKPQYSEIDKPLIYADYYFIEALLKYKKTAPILTAAGGNNQISLNWNKSTGATYYSIQRSNSKEGPYSTIVYKTSKTAYVNSGLAAGKTYYYKITSCNAMGAGETSNEAHATTNHAPIVEILKPGNEAKYNSPANINLEAKAMDLDGTIKKVQFFNGNTLLKTEYYSPYTCSWQNVQPGTYSITAKGTDNKGLTATSEAITIVVGANNSFFKTVNPTTANKGVKLKYEYGFKLVPNPVHNTVTIFTSNAQPNKKLTISIISSSGVEVKTIQANSLYKSIILNLSSLRSGVYVVRLTCEQEVMCQQLIKL